jgi:uncharacterized protein (DUF2062 family)
MKRRVLGPIMAQLKQGITPEKLALSLGLGLTLGVFPVIGATTLLCLGAGIALRLNQPALQLFNYLAYPLQIPLILAFVRFGESLVGAPPVPFSVPALLVEFGKDPLGFFVKFGLTGLHGILGWTVVAPFVVAALYFIALPLLKRAAGRLADRRALEETA